MENESGKWLTVVNVHAGSGKTVHLWEKAKRLMAARGIDFLVRLTLHERHAAELAFDAAKMGCRKFIAVGGDGTVHEVLCGIMTFVERFRKKLEDYTLAVIPIGSGNDWIKTHNVPLDVDTAVDLIAAGSFAPQDVVRATVLCEGRGEVSGGDGGFDPDGGSGGDGGFDPDGGSGGDGSFRDDGRVAYMVNVGGIGYDARICDTVNRWKEVGRRGAALYIKSLIFNFFHYKSMNVEVECDGEVVHRGPTFSIAFGNGLYSGGGFVQVPEAECDDGLLDVTVIPGFSKLRILREIPKLFARKILTIKGVVARKAKSVVVRPVASDREIMEVDGEIVGRVPVRLEVCGGLLRVLLRF